MAEPLAAHGGVVIWRAFVGHEFGGELLTAALIWADSNQHGRQYGWECARLSGRVDAVRIPKERRQ